MMLIWANIEPRQNVMGQMIFLISISTKRRVREMLNLASGEMREVCQQPKKQLVQLRDGNLQIKLPQEDKWQIVQLKLESEILHWDSCCPQATLRLQMAGEPSPLEKPGFPNRPLAIAKSHLPYAERGSEVLLLGQHPAVHNDDLVSKVPCLDHPQHGLCDFVRATNDT